MTVMSMFNAKRFIRLELEGRVISNDKLRDIVHSHVGQMVRELDHLDTYITSFSTEGDSLPQWRGYCPNGQGVAQFLSASIKSGEFGPIAEDYQRVDLKLLKCAYTPKKKSSARYSPRSFLGTRRPALRHGLDGARQLSGSADGNMLSVLQK